MRSLFLVFMVWLIAGCSTHFSTLRSDSSSAKIVYVIPEEQAFQIAFSALTSTLPGREITDIDGPVKGYSTDFRFLLDTYSQQVMVIPVLGKDAEGKAVRGYYFEVSGSGSSVVQGRAKNVQLFEAVSSAAKATEKAVVVSSVATAPYLGSRWKQNELKHEKTQSADKSETKDDTLNQIERLKQLYDRGVITEGDFERKKKELLERI